MADEKSEPDLASAAKRRRPAPTIDLKATEIASEPVTAPEPTESAEEKPAEAAASPAPSEEKTEAAEPQAASAAEAKARRPWAGLGVVGERLSGLHTRAVGWLGSPMLVAAIASAVVTLCIVLGLWAFTGPSSSDERADALAARMTVLEMKIGDLAKRPQAAAETNVPADLTARIAKAERAVGALAALDGRVAKAEQSAGAIAALDARLAKLEKAPPPQAGPAPNNQALVDRVAALEASLRDARSRADAALDAAQKTAAPAATAEADHKDIEALAARVSALDQATKSADERFARASAAGADKAGRLAFMALVLRTAVERGDPFTSELAAVKPLVADPALIAPLEPFAAAGVPRAAVLGRELSQLTGAMLNAAGGAPREAGIFDRLQQGAEKLVRIRPINETPGDDPATVISRAEVKAANGDLAGAIAELSRLPDAARAPANGWIKKAEAQAAALGAARRLAENAASGLAKP